MKKVIFFCLLSISTCMSRPDGTRAPESKILTNSTPTSANDQISTAFNTSQAPIASEHVDVPSIKSESTIQPEITTLNVTQSKSTDNKLTSSSPATNTNKSSVDTNKTSDKPEPKQEEAKVEPTKIDNTKPQKHEETKVGPGKVVAVNSTTIVPVTEKVDNTNTVDKNAPKSTNTTVKPEASTKPGVTSSSTEAPKATEVPPQKARSFDGPSFIGGIILTIGLLAIGFMGFKYYKNKMDGNYQIL